MNDVSTDETTKQIVRKKLVQMLGDSGLIEYSCRTPDCRSQVFSTWQVDLCCNQCGKRLTVRNV